MTTVYIYAQPHTCRITADEAGYYWHVHSFIHSFIHSFMQCQYTYTHVYPPPPTHTHTHTPGHGGVCKGE